MRLLRLLLVAALSALCLGCAGYHIGPVKPAALADVHTICVQNFKNDTLEPRVETLLANSFIRQLQRDGTYKITDESHADAILEGTLMRITREPARSVRGNVLQAREYVLHMEVRLQLYNRRTGRPLVLQTIYGSTNFFATDGRSIIATDVNNTERQTIPTAVEDVAGRGVSLLTEGW